MSLMRTEFETLIGVFVLEAVNELPNVDRRKYNVTLRFREPLIITGEMFHQPYMILKRYILFECERLVKKCSREKWVFE